MTIIRHIIKNHKSGKFLKDSQRNSTNLYIEGLNIEGLGSISFLYLRSSDLLTPQTGVDFNKQCYMPNLIKTFFVCFLEMGGGGTALVIGP